MQTYAICTLFAAISPSVSDTAAAAIAADEAVKKRLEANGQIIRGSTPAEFDAAIEDQRAKISAIVRVIGKAPQ